MDMLCNASANFAFRDDYPTSDRHNVPPESPRPSLSSAWIDIDLIFDFEYANLAMPQVLSHKISWEGGLTPLCGSCSFCNLLQEGLYRNIKPEVSVSVSQLVSSQLSDTCIAKVKVKLHALDHLTDASSWIVGTKAERVEDLFLIVLRGTAAVDLNGVASKSFTVEVPFELFAKEHSPVAKHLNIHRRPLEKQSLSEANVKRIRGWLDECDNKHENCQQGVWQYSSLTTSPLPTRLIDVGDLFHHPRMVITSSLRQLQAPGNIDARYIALSYCWGSPDDSRTLLRTTGESLTSRLESIPMDVMPQTFQDAVTTARALQIPYIWIDSLCIIQDDIHDWQMESSKMADIFSNAYLTVIAAAGVSCHDSFLAREPHEPHCEMPFKSEIIPGLEGCYQLRHRPGTKWWGTDKMAGISGHRWIDRGWTFQEERLAGRVLMFGVNKFFFDCRSFEMAEDTNLRKPRPKWSEILNEVSKTNDEAVQSTKWKTSWTYQRKLLAQWCTLCNHYSRRNLTFDYDKLSAFSGMANNFAKSINSVYLAGMWKNHLKHDLFWHTHDIARKPKSYRAPSWSWAAVDAEIRWKFSLICEGDMCTMYCNIQDAQTTIAGLDPFGAVKDGYLKISGVVLEVELIWDVDGLSVKQPWCVCVNGQEIARANLDAEKNEPPPGFEKKRSWALLVAKCAGQKSQPRGLILQKTGRKRDGLEEFQREGIFRIFSYILPDTNSNTRSWEESYSQSIIIT